MHLPLSHRLIGGHVTASPIPSTPATRPERLRVGLLLPAWYLGGVERYHLALARWTSDRIEWVGCALIAGSMCRQTSIDALTALMPVHADPSAGAGEVRWNVTRHESEQQAIDAVLSQCDVLLTWGVQSLDSRLAGFSGRVVVISHGDGQWTRGWLREASTRATDFVAVSRDAAAAFDSDNVTILPGGVELDRLAPTQSRNATRKQLGVDGKIAVGFVGRFSPEKNPALAARIVGQLGDGYVAVYHGHVPWGEAEFRAQATELAQGRIVWAGPEWHTGDIYRALDCLVQGSPAEGGPLVAMEAWCTELPLVTTNVGIVRDDLDLQRCSAIVSGDLSRWCAAVKNATSDESDQAVDDAYVLATERYSAAAMARRWEEFLDWSASGPGSTLVATRRIRERLPELLQELSVRSLLDIPCGDLHWISRLDLPPVYIGADISIEQLAQNRRRFPTRQFEHLDLTADRLPAADAVLCRDCLVHLRFDQVRAAIANIVASGATWLISTHFPGRVNQEIKPGTWHEVWRPLDLTAAPIGLPAPRHVINEGCTWGHGEYADKSLGVWNVDDIRAAWSNNP